MKMTFLKRKRLIGVGVAVGVLWVVCFYAFGKHSPSEKEFKRHLKHKIRMATRVHKKATEKIFEQEDNAMDGSVYGDLEEVKYEASTPNLKYFSSNINNNDFRDNVVKSKMYEGVDFGDKFDKKQLGTEKAGVGIIRTGGEGMKTPVVNQNRDGRKRRKGKKNRQKKKKTKADKKTVGGRKVEYSSKGDNGTGVLIDLASLSREDKATYEGLVKLYGYNVMAGDQIPFKRALPDVRTEACKRFKARDYNSKVSIIIAFYNEALSSLYRTVHSILDRTPDSLLEEILLVDDGSTLKHLQSQLEDYAENHRKLRVVRTHARMGVIQARQMGAELAKGKIFAFLDSHVEVTAGWLEPLVDSIEKNENYVMTSVMDIINDETMEYKAFTYDSINVGGFTWALAFAWIGVPQRVKKLLKSREEPISTPTMPGGGFVISRSFFTTLGGFDVGMDKWGGENFEMSFKVWMCGGRLLTHPCSHLGHIFKKGTVYQLGSSLNPRKNYQRVAEVWMDDYKKLFYSKTKSKVGDIGDISSRLKLRKRLSCNSFQWYIDHVYPEIFMPSKAIFKGELRNSRKAKGDGVLFTACLDTNNDLTKGLSIWPCHGQGGNQYWMMSGDGEIRNEEECFDYAGSQVLLLPCHGQKGNQEWLYVKDEGLLRHINTNLCLGLQKDLTGLTMGRCDGSAGQHWQWGNSNKFTTLPSLPQQAEKVEGGFEEEEEEEEEKEEGEEEEEKEEEEEGGEEEEEKEENREKEEDGEGREGNNGSVIAAEGQKEEEGNSLQNEKEDYYKEY